MKGALLKSSAPFPSTAAADYFLIFAPASVAIADKVV